MMVGGAIRTGNMGGVGGASRTSREWEGWERWEGNGREYLGGALKVSEGWRIDKFAIY